MRAPLKNLLIMVLVLTIGLSLAPYIVGVVMDVFAVSVHSATGWDLGGREIGRASCRERV